MSSQKFLRDLRELGSKIYIFFFRNVIDTLFHMDWYHNAPKIHFLGIGTIQNPMDMWVKQEIIFDVKPDVIVETGTRRGGTAMYYAMLMSVINPHGKVVTVEIDPAFQTPKDHHLWKTYVTPIIGDSTSDAVVKQVEELVRGKKVVVVLDSWHEKNHVRKEMELYGRLVAPGSYLIVEDTNVNGNPVGPDHGPGPHEAVVDFLKTHHEYTVDRAREKMRFTFHPGGYLKKNAS